MVRVQVGEPREHSSAVAASALHAECRGFESLCSHYKYFKKIMDELYQSLHKAQTTLFCLMQKTWVYHWNVIGSDFFQLHEAFGEQYTTMQGELDRLTEHMRYLRMKAIAQISRVVETSEISDASANPTDKLMVSQLLADNKKMIEILTSVVQESEKTKQHTTSSIAEDLMETHGKFVWMLRSYLKE